MELSQEETRLIEMLREIDTENPLGIDGYSEANYLEILFRILDGVPAEGRRRYQLFLKNSKGQRLVNLKEAQRMKLAHEDIRSTESSKAEYERTYKDYGLPRPVWAKQGEG